MVADQGDGPYTFKYFLDDLRYAGYVCLCWPTFPFALIESMFVDGYTPALFNTPANRRRIERARLARIKEEEDAKKKTYAYYMEAKYGPTGSSRHEEEQEKTKRNVEEAAFAEEEWKNGQRRE